MPEAERQDQRDDRALLAACQQEVSAARERLEDARRRGARQDIEPLRELLIAALEGYAATIERSGAPLPQRLQGELRLYRGLGRH
ncbi:MULTISPECIES: hypothetical protein [Pimelobacter]|uniref:hypothetical protein n=1 Tax=Pimelobacter TaxID=2044 RepID=UPI001C03F5AC|nr:MULTISPECIES: hypothetical protein [Pimelobacter]MBU2694429.1 hypothetical protein [Pimelobacter sp. 30-1]UUW88809.1 hypothetical protein M0M43_24175 [Pimelobacter simplex]UUW98314.1 hypothetical protein M0M48_12825 [Pimelobacter simplex]